MHKYKSFLPNCKWKLKLINIQAQNMLENDINFKSLKGGIEGNMQFVTQIYEYSEL